MAAQVHQTHLLRMGVEPRLDVLEKMLMLPAGNPALLARGAATLDGAAVTRIGPVAAQVPIRFLIGVVVDQELPGSYPRH